MGLAKSLPNDGLKMLAIVAMVLCVADKAYAACPVAQLATSVMLVEPDFRDADNAVPAAEAVDAVIRDIRISNGDIFDTNDPQHDGLIHHFMNAVHIQTKEAVIRRQLLVASGDPYSPDDLAETTRFLRANKYLSDAEITTTNCDDGFVDLDDKTADSWSLMPSISFSRKGGQNFGGFRIEESNLFGTGSDVRLGYKSGIDRDSISLRYYDRQIGDSRTELSLLLADNSDGSSYAMDLQQPFYSLDARRAGGIRVASFEQLDGIYELGEVVDEVQHDARQFEAFFGRSQGLQAGFVRRSYVGLSYDDHRFDRTSPEPVALDLPTDRRDIYPFVGVEWLQDRYEKTRNVEQMHRVEDRHTGARLAVRIGYAATAIGADDNAWLLGLVAEHGLHPVRNGTLLLRSGLDGRWPSAAATSYRLHADARYYHRQSPKRLFFVQLSAAAGKRLDTDELLTLGGDTGLRGYPVRYQNGDGTALLTLEQRYYTDWYPFHLFRVGAAAFFDAGTVWGSHGSPEADLGLLRDAGVGLRIGSPHSSSGRMLHIDMAYALDGPADVRGWQLHIETRKRF